MLYDSIVSGTAYEYAPVDSGVILCEWLIWNGVYGLFWISIIIAVRIACDKSAFAVYKGPLGWIKYRYIIVSIDLKVSYEVAADV